eukprot:356058-Chlamydomonas_euryale.AAC.9
MVHCEVHSSLRGCCHLFFTALARHLFIEPLTLPTPPVVKVLGLLQQPPQECQSPGQPSRDGSHQPGTVTHGSGGGRGHRSPCCLVSDGQFQCEQLGCEQPGFWQAPL